MTTANERTSAYPIDPMFLERWSPRAFTAEPMPEADLLAMIEAGHWAASSYNGQPWRFLYALRDTPDWTRFLDLLVPANKAWAERAAALLIIVSDSMTRRPNETPTPSHSHSFDTGMAVAQFVLQGMRLGYHCHGMGGFDRTRAAQELNVPDDHRLEAAFAVGRRAEKSVLPESTRAREQPNGRKPVESVAFAGGFPE